jgi:hypothetical protein
MSLPATSGATALPSDFPDWMSPTLVKELRQGLKARAFVITFIALQTLFVVVVAASALIYARKPESYEPEFLNSIFWMLVGVQLVVVTPLRALSSLAGERKANTLELNFMTGLSSWRMAVGKWASLLFQAALFVLAVLPYGLVRYYFGGVNLTEDLIALVMMFIACALLTATALAVSGMPLFFRVAAACIAGFFAMGIGPGFLVGFAMRSSGIGAPFFSLPGREAWLAVLGGATLLTVGALEIASATIAPPAENHALRQRLIALTAWLPVPVLMALRVDQSWIIACSIFFGVVALLTAFQHLSVPPMPLRTHLEPFARWGLPGKVASAFFQPGWPGAVLFLLLVAGMLALSGLWTAQKRPDREHFIATMALLLAALMTPAALLNSLRWRPKFPIAGHLLVLLVGGGMAIFLNLLDTHDRWKLSDYPALGFFPPLGLWAMPGLNSAHRELFTWQAVSIGMFGVCLAALLLQSWRYWRRIAAIYAEIRRDRKAPTAEPARA